MECPSAARVDHRASRADAQAEWGEAHRTYEGRYGPSALEGEVKENRIAFIVTFNAEGTKTTGVFQGTVDGATMGGSVEFDGAGSGTWSAVRAKADPK